MPRKKKLKLVKILYILKLFNPYINGKVKICEMNFKVTYKNNLFILNLFFICCHFLFLFVSFLYFIYFILNFLRTKYSANDVQIV